MSEPQLWDRTVGLVGIARALIVIAHPDDAEYGAAGTVALLVQNGVEVTYLVMTDGASGSQDPAMTRGALAANRHMEQTAACGILGVSHIEWGGYMDGYLEASIPARRVVAAAIRRHRPHLVITLDPEMRFTPHGHINHPDHRAVGDLVLHSINPAASTRLWDTTLLDEGLEPWDVRHLWLIGFSGGPDRVDIGGTFDRKLEALRCHASQLGDRDPEPRMREWANAVGHPVGVDLAEPFRMLTL